MRTYEAGWKRFCNSNDETYITTTARPGMTKIPSIIPWQESYNNQQIRLFFAHQEDSFIRLSCRSAIKISIRPKISSENALKTSTPILAYSSLRPWQTIFINIGKVLWVFYLNFCPQLVVLLHDIVHVVLRHVCPLIRLLYDDGV